MGYKKVVIESFGNADVVKVVEEECLPEPGAGEARIKVEASSAVFTDMLIRRRLYPALLGEKLPIVLGYDLIGVVDELSVGVAGLSVGQRVADLTVIGGNAEYVCRPAEDLVQVPESLDAAEAESIPLSHMTAFQMLTRVADVQPGQKILIQGATGAVGTALLQLGKLLDLEMIGTASARNHDLIEEYGARAIDYRASDYRQQLRNVTGFDAVFEGSGSVASAPLLRKGGVLVSYGFTGLIRKKQNDSRRCLKPFVSLMKTYWGLPRPCQKRRCLNAVTLPGRARTMPPPTSSPGLAVTMLGQGRASNAPYDQGGKRNKTSTSR